MNYLLLMYPEAEPREVEPSHEQCVRDCRTLVDRLDSNGQFVAAGILESPTMARRVAVHGGHRLVTDGPFVETREQFAGYLLIEAESLDEAVAIAEEHPVAQSGKVEVWPIKQVSFQRQPLSVASVPSS